MGDQELPSARKKLLILTLGGVLCDRIFIYDSKKRVLGRKADTVIGNFSVYKRPYCEGFLRFCFKHFIVGVWSGSARHNEERTVDYLFGKMKNELAFEWHQDYCTSTGLMDPEKNRKPVLLKELSKIWETDTPDLLEGANFGASNTVLIEDSPYTAIRNPPNTTLFLSKYSANDVADTFLKDRLQPYLERLAKASNVQMFIKENPFGNPALNSSSPHWNHFKHLIIPESHHQTLRLSNPETKDNENIMITDLLSGFGAVVLNKDPAKSEGKFECKDKAAASSSTENRDDNSSVVL